MVTTTGRQLITTKSIKYRDQEGSERVIITVLTIFLRFLVDDSWSCGLSANACYTFAEIKIIDGGEDEGILYRRMAQERITTSCNSLA